MKIICAASVLHAKEAFSHLGEVDVIRDGDIGPSEVRYADALIIRSKTKVNAELLCDSSLRFVGTATAGFDHIDVPLLDQRDIALSVAAGCNADSVADYITAALLESAVSKGARLTDMTLGVIGVGQVGSRVVGRAQALGMKTLWNDPPLHLKSGNEVYLPLEDVLEGSDAITLHTPLTHTGPFPTFHLANCRFLSKLKTNTWFFNAARGEVMDESAVETAIESGLINPVVLDVWEGEPHVNAGLLSQVALGSAHIAGYSFDGRLNGTRMAYNDLCHFLEVEPKWDHRPFLPEPDQPIITVQASGLSDEEALCHAVRQAYDLRHDDALLRSAISKPEPKVGFKRLRNQYRVRREFTAYRIHWQGASAALKEKAAALGFGDTEN